MDMGQLNLRHLKAVIATAESGSVSAAARQVNLTQPALTQGIARLEQAIGLPLFERRPGGMVPTDAASILIPRAAAALRMVGGTRVTVSQMRAFTALARHGSYAAAALASGVREASLHRAVGDLAIGLGQRLVERRGRGVALTGRGQVLARRFRLAEAELRAALAELAALQGREIGRIVIGAMPLSRARLLPTAVAAFNRVHPEIDIGIVEGSHADLVGPLRDGDIDIMIGALRDPAPADDLVQRPLFADRPVILGGARHPLARRAEQISAADLAGFDWIVPAEGTPLRAQWKQMFDLNGVKPPRVAIECGSVVMVRQLLVQSDYLTLLSPDQVALELEAGWLARIGKAPGNPSRTIGLTTRAGWRPTPLQASLVAAIDEAAEEIGRSATISKG
jgi:DNA-binding transcriptional LysR family regulator